MVQNRKLRHVQHAEPLFTPLEFNPKEAWPSQIKRLRERFDQLDGAMVVGECEGMERRLGSELTDMGAARIDRFGVAYHSYTCRWPGRTVEVSIADTGSGAFVTAEESVKGDVKGSVREMEGLISPGRLSELLDVLKKLDAGGKGRHKKHVYPLVTRRYDRMMVTSYELNGIKIDTEELIPDDAALGGIPDYMAQDGHPLKRLGIGLIMNTLQGLPDVRNQLFVTTIKASSKRPEDAKTIGDIFHKLEIGEPINKLHRMLQTGVLMPEPAAHTDTGIIAVLKEPTRLNSIDLSEKSNFQNLMAMISGKGRARHA